MSTWTLEVEVEWPQSLSAAAWEALIREVVDPLHRENIVVSDVRLVQKAELSALRSRGAARPRGLPPERRSHTSPGRSRLTPCARIVSAQAEHVHEWEPCGTAQDEQIVYSPVSAMDHVRVTRTLAIRSCKCGAVRCTEVARKERWLNR